VNKAVSQLDQGTQQNAALVEQSSAAAISLSEQARRLQEAVGSFRLA
jgi:methyl-accepting chemotaxis protein